nr:immunoglobulin light chain junction region [Macaca mulatta]
CQQYNDFVFTF